MTDKISCQAMIFMFQFFMRYALRTTNYYIPIIELQNIRTFPHITEIIIISFNFAKKFPFLIAADFFINQSCAVSRTTAFSHVTHALSRHCKISFTVAIEKVWISEMRRVTFRIAIQLNFIFMNAAVFLQCSETLGNCTNIIFIASVASIKYANFAIFNKTATAVTAVFIMFVGRIQHKFRHGVIYKIFRAGMHPRFIFMPILIFRARIPLTTNMIYTVAIRQAVRIRN